MFSITQQEKVLEISLQTKIEEVIETSNKTNKQLKLKNQNRKSLITHWK